MKPLSNVIGGSHFEKRIPHIYFFNPMTDELYYTGQTDNCSYLNDKILQVSGTEGVMKKINSIWYGGTILGIGIIFAIVIPLLLHYTSFVFGLKENFPMPIRISIIIGVLILLLFLVLLAIELKQDKRINRQYSKTRNSKIALSNNIFECQNCGNRQIEKEDMSCRVCGIRFDR